MRLLANTDGSFAPVSGSLELSLGLTLLLIGASG